MDNCLLCNAKIRNIPAGISKKSGKSYPAFSVCSVCGWKPPQEDTEFLITQPLQGVYSSEPQKPEIPKNTLKPIETQGGGNSKAMIFAYAKDLTVARLQLGMPEIEPVQETINTFQEFWKAFNK